MNQLLEFMGNHAVLFGVFFAMLGALVWTVIGSAGSQKITPAAATRLINDDQALVLDVRGDGEFGEGHIVNALHIPLGFLTERLDKLEKYRSRTIIPVCRTGQQSSLAVSKLKKSGFDNVRSMSGGILAWQDANLPLTKK